MFNFTTPLKGRVLKIIGGCFLALYLYNKDLFTSSPNVVNNIYLGSESDFAGLERKLEFYHITEGAEKPKSWYEEGLKTLERLSSRQEEYATRLTETKEHLAAAYDALFGASPRSQEANSKSTPLEERVTAGNEENPDK